MKIFWNKEKPILSLLNLIACILVLLFVIGIFLPTYLPAFYPDNEFLRPKDEGFQVEAFNVSPYGISTEKLHEDINILIPAGSSKEDAENLLISIAGFNHTSTNSELYKSNYFHPGDMGHLCGHLFHRGWRIGIIYDENNRVEKINIQLPCSKEPGREKK